MPIRKPPHASSWRSPIRSSRCRTARIHIEKINWPFLSEFKGNPAEYRMSTMLLSKVAALALIVGALSLVSVSSARAASDCSMSVTLTDWGENSTGDIDVASGRSCLFPIRMRGRVGSSDISQKPAHGKLKRLNISTYEYTAKARYKGGDTFAIKATGQGPTASGTSVITVHATIK
jgi:hypothetical protein